MKKKRIKRKARKAAFCTERYRTMLVQGCSCRCRLHELIAEVDCNDPKWPALSAAMTQAKIAVEDVERKLARASQVDYPGLKLPTICINRK